MHYLNSPPLHPVQYHAHMLEQMPLSAVYRSVTSLNLASVGTESQDF